MATVLDRPTDGRNDEVQPADRAGSPPRGPRRHRTRSVSRARWLAVLVLVMSVNVGLPDSTAFAMKKRLYGPGAPLSPSVWYMRVCPSGVVARSNSLRSELEPKPTWMFVQVAPLSVERQTPFWYAVA